MKLDIDQTNELRRKLAQFFLDYSVVHSKNVVMRYANFPGAMIARANEIPNVDEFIGILTNEP